MKLRTAILFQLLIKTLHPDLVCDVGSLDGTHARRFRRLLPHTRIIAFEANPGNMVVMQQNEELKKDHIQVVHKAVWNEDDVLAFHVVEASSTDTSEIDRRGISSTRERVSHSFATRTIKVTAVRLDTFIKNMDFAPETIALWIDVEGAAFEVLEGIEAIRRNVKVVHVEVETRKMWRTQKLQPDVESLMQMMGFVKLARGFDELQHDIVFLDVETFAESPFRFRAIVLVALILTLLQKVGGRVFHWLVGIYFSEKH